MIFNHCIGGGKKSAFVTVYGAPSETVTLTPLNGSPVSLTLNANGISSVKEIPIGLYNVIGSTSKEILTSGRSVLVEKNTTKVNAYPDGAIYWFGNGDVNGDSLYKGAYTYTAGQVPDGKSGSSGRGDLVAEADYVGASMSVPSSSGSKYGGTTWSPQISVDGYSYVNLYAYSRHSSRAAFGFPAEKATKWATDMYVAPEDSVYQLYSMAVPSGRTSGYLGASVFNCTSGATSAYAYIKAAWRDDKEVTPIGEQLAGTNSVKVLSDTYRYLSSNGSWSTAGSISTDNYVGSNSSGFNTALIPVGSFSFSGNSTRLRLSFYGYCPSVNFYVDGFRWAICTSDANKALYQTTNDVTSDNTQIAKGIAKLAYNNGTYKTYEIDLASDAIPANKPLYVYFWSKDAATDIAHFRGTLTASLYYEA